MVFWEIKLEDFYQLKKIEIYQMLNLYIKEKVFIINIQFYKSKIFILYTFQFIYYILR